MRTASRLICFVLTLGIFAMPVFAQSNPKVIGEYRAWLASTYKGSCYISSRPKESTTEPKNVQRGAIHFLVTHNQGGRVKDEVSIYAGYTYKKGSVTLAIDGQDFGKRGDLFTDRDSAWARDAETDRKLVQAMVRGNSMVVRGTSSRGTLTIDTYSLYGLTAARNAINKACKVR